MQWFTVLLFLRNAGVLMTQFKGEAALWSQKLRKRIFVLQVLFSNSAASKA